MRRVGNDLLEPTLPLLPCDEPPPERQATELTEAHGAYYGAWQYLYEGARPFVPGTIDMLYAIRDAKLYVFD